MKPVFDRFNSKQAGGGGVFDAPPLVFVCLSTLIFDTITVKFFDFYKIEI